MSLWFDGYLKFIDYVFVDYIDFVLSLANLTK